MTVNVSDTQQIQCMYIHNHDWLFRWLKHRLNCDETAADLTQDTFVKLLRSPLPQPLNEPRAYIVTNEVWCSDVILFAFNYLKYQFLRLYFILYIVPVFIDVFLLLHHTVG
ncbi:sigma factor [Photorhabdus bodei]|uniref:sigma factor n=1 Tax=Photorhabdus TaxID=29487 RepID=UPI001E391006|nr:MULTISPECIES: sigma factor [Photorhabdus]